MFWTPGISVGYRAGFPNEMGSVMFLVLAGLAIFLIYYYTKVVRKPEVMCHPGSENDQYFQRSEILNRRYWVTPWMFNTHLQLIYLGLKKTLAPKLEYDRLDTLTTDDNGTIAVEWLGLDLPAETPTLVLLHTISGSGHSMRDFVRYIHQHAGWRVALCVRRGHSGLALTSAKYNTMGCTEDFRIQLQHIESCFPQSPLYAVGTSAGSGVLARYLGEAGKNTPIKAAVGYCPGYNMEVAFSRAKAPYSGLMAKKMARNYLHPNKDWFDTLPSYQKALQAADLDELHDHLYEVSGYPDYDSYLADTNPMVPFENIAVPTLMLNAKDDPVCHIDNVHDYKEAMSKMENILLVVTDRGSHCAYYEGLNATSWAHKLIVEYLKFFAKTDAGHLK
ncbi:YheT family hydrolase [Bacterioplanoides sp.]|uniref:YheT family hydrolase n=1 Tax=Bacterioplanoides sp. TaxID=2066072 RepID=UPI003AFFBC3E